MKAAVICIVALCIGLASARLSGAGEEAGHHHHHETARRAVKISQQQRPVIMEGGQISLTAPIKFKADMNDGEEDKMVTRRFHESAMHDADHAFSILLLLLTFTMVGVFAMLSSSDSILKKNTWSMIDTLAVVVIATTSFSMIEIFFEEMMAESPHMHMLLHVLYALTLFFVALFGSYRLRHNKTQCDAFMGVMFWIVLMAKSGAIGKAANKYGDGPHHTTLINFGCVIFLVVLIVIAHFIKQKHFADQTWYDGTETGIMGGAFGGSLAFLAHIWIHEHFPSDPADPFSEASHANIIAKDCWAALTCVLACVLTTPIGNMITKATNENKYWYSRFLSFLNSTVGILPYFAVSVGSGDWFSHKMGFHPNDTGAHLISTGCSTFWGIAMILACSFIPALKKMANAEGFSLAHLMLGFGGFLAGYGWAALITHSMMKLNRGWGWTDSEQNRCTVMTVFFLNAMAIPVYVTFLKPAVDKAQSAK